MQLSSTSANTAAALAAAAGIPGPSALTTGLLAAPSVAAGFPIVASPAAVLVGPARAPVSYDSAFNHLISAMAKTRSDLEPIFAQARRQSEGWYRFSLISASIGYLVIVLAVVALVLGRVTEGILATASSALPHGLASISSARARHADNRLDSIREELTKSRELDALLEIANTVDDPSLRNALKAEVVRQVLAKITGTSAVSAP